MTTLTTISPPRAARRIDQTQWRIDPRRSHVGFRTRSVWGLVTVEGEFGSYEGTLDLERQPAIELTIDAGSLDTKNKLRDHHLRSSDFFDVARYPEVRFVSERAALAGERLALRGRLQAGGGSLPLELDATLRQVGDELKLDATVQADHEQLGLSSGLLGMIRTPSELIVRGRLVRWAAES
jgi:polyisoprenoid-binding protein YceI